MRASLAIAARQQRRHMKTATPSRQKVFGSSIILTHLLRGLTVNKKVSAIILAAGLGPQAKALKPLLLWKETETFLGKVYRSLLDTKAFQEIIVVTGCEPIEVEREAKRLGLKSIFNSDFEVGGMHSAIRIGLKSLKGPWDGVLVCHVDQPQIESDEYLGLVRAFSSSEVTLALPSYRGRLGHPALIGKEHFAEIQAQSDGDWEGSSLFKRYPSKTLALEMPTARCLMAFDTPIDVISK